jgi:hypothetical protein
MQIPRQQHAHVVLGLRVPVASRVGVSTLYQRHQRSIHDASQLGRSHASVYEDPAADGPQPDE